MFFLLPESDGFLLAGGAALVAQNLSTRATLDVDLFANPTRGNIPAARDGLARAAELQGWAVEVLRDSSTFCRLSLVRADEYLTIDLAIDSSPGQPPIMSILGPSFAPEELAGRKTIALFNRAEPRDFVDVFVLSQRFGKENLLSWAREVDAGFSLPVFVDMIRSIRRFKDERLPISAACTEDLRSFFEDWATELSAR